MVPSNDSHPSPPRPTGEELRPVAARFPQLGLGFVAAATLIVLELAGGGLLGWAKAAGTLNQKLPNLKLLLLSGWAVYLGGYGYWLWCVYRIHRLLAEATNSTYPVTARQAVAYQFIPIYNLVWNFNWPRRIADFVNRSHPTARMSGVWVGIVLLLAWILGSVDQGLQILVLFSVGAYLTHKLRPIMSSAVPLIVSSVVPLSAPAHARLPVAAHLALPKEWILPAKAGAGATFGFLLCYGFLWLTGQIALGAKANVAEECVKLFVVAVLLWFFVEPLFGLLGELLGFQEEHSPAQVGTLSRLVRFAIFVCVVIGSHTVLEQTFAHSYDRVGLVLRAMGLTFLFVGLTYSLIVATGQSRFAGAALVGVGVPALAALGMVAFAVDFHYHPEPLGPNQVVAAAFGPEAVLLPQAANTPEPEQKEEVGEIPLPSAKDISVMLGGSVLLAFAGFFALRLNWGPKGVAGLVFITAALSAAVIYKYSLLSRIHMFPGLWAAFWWCIGILAFCEDDLLRSPAVPAESTKLRHGSPLRQDVRVQVLSLSVLILLVALFWIIPRADVNVSLASLNPKVPQGSPVTLTATIAPLANDSETPTGIVVFHCEDCESGKFSAQEKLVDGVAPHVVTLPVGAHWLAAQYGGDLSFRGPKEEAKTQIVVSPPPILTQVNVNSSHPNATLGSPVTFTATVTPARGGAGALTGNIIFRCDNCDSTDLPAEEPLSNGVASHVATLPLGTHWITAAYPGADNFIASSSPPLRQLIQVGGGQDNILHPDIPEKNLGVLPHNTDTRSVIYPLLVAPPGTPITVRTLGVIDSSKTKIGQSIAATLALPIVLNGRILVPPGSTAILKLTNVDLAGRFDGRPAVTLQLASIIINGRTFAVSSTSIRREVVPLGPGVAKKAGIGAAVGGAIGGIFGHKKGATAGAASGEAAGAGSQAFLVAGAILIPPESLLIFRVQPH